MSFFTALLSLVACTSKQEASTDDTFHSTVVNPDGTVTFNYHGPNVKSVQVDVQFAGRHDMVLDSITGVWSLTLGPAAPDIYPYCFIAAPN